jgi:hypothetical protein
MEEGEWFFILKNRSRLPHHYFIDPIFFERIMHIVHVFTDYILNEKINYSMNFFCSHMKSHLSQNNVLKTPLLINLLSVRQPQSHIQFAWHFTTCHLGQLFVKQTTLS